MLVSASVTDVPFVEDTVVANGANGADVVGVVDMYYFDEGSVGVVVFVVIEFPGCNPYPYKHAPY